MIDWQKNYHRVFQKYVASELLNIQIINTEIDSIDAQIRALQLKRKRLVAIKHQQEKEKLAERGRV